MPESKALLKSLTDVNGISGHEMQVKSLMKDYLTPVSDDIVEDQLGGIFGKKNATHGTKSLMISGHLDELALSLHKLMNKDTFISRQLVDGGIKSCYLKSDDYY